MSSTSAKFSIKDEFKMSLTHCLPKQGGFCNELRAMAELRSESVKMEWKCLGIF